MHGYILKKKPKKVHVLTESNYVKIHAMYMQKHKQLATLKR